MTATTTFIDDEISAVPTVIRFIRLIVPIPAINHQQQFMILVYDNLL